jgi:Tol biopolymer transport system component
MRADGTRLRLLLRSRDDDYPVAWSRDGHILLTRVSRSRPHADVYTMRLNGHGLRRLTRCPRFCYAADFSGDGKRVLYTRVVGLENSERGQVFVIRRDGSHPRNLSHNRADENAASWRG